MHLNAWGVTKRRYGARFGRRCSRLSDCVWAVPPTVIDDSKNRQRRTRVGERTWTALRTYSRSLSWNARSPVRLVSPNRISDASETRCCQVKRPEIRFSWTNNFELMALRFQPKIPPAPPKLTRDRGGNRWGES